MEENQQVTLESLKGELAAYFAALAVVVEECYEDEAGHRMLGIGLDHPFGTTFFSRIKVENTRIGKLLPVWHRYAYEGVLAAGFSARMLDRVDGALERLADMLGLLRPADAYFEDALAGAGVEDQLQGHLVDLVARLRARISLDTGTSLTLMDLGLLASMAERSVRNALSAEGEGRLSAQADGTVSNEEARRWLAGRRGYKPSVHREFPADIEATPADLEGIELPGFLSRRLAALWGDSAKANDNYTWVAVIAREAGLPPERIKAAMSLPLDIRPQDCEPLARVLRVDPVWFTHQVMTALFPQQIDMLLNPDHWETGTNPFANYETQTAVTVSLSVPMLAHGYIDFPITAKSMFPEDCFGSRKDGDEGNQVEIIFGSHREFTDIRIKSAKTISPRRRFTAWLNTELGAKAGDRIRLEKTAERQFTLAHIVG